MDEWIYLDHNATTPLLPEVVDAMLPFLRQHFGNPSSDHALGRTARLAVATARDQVAALIGAHPDEIIFTSGGTESNNLAIRGVAAALDPSRWRIVTSNVEHPATVQPVALLESRGWAVTRQPVTAGGCLDPGELSAITADVGLVTLMLAQNETGALMPAAAAGEAARSAGAVMHTDAAQAVGKIRVDVEALHVDLLSVAGHKLNAPKGVGALYVRRGTPLHPVLRGASQEGGIRPGTENVASIVGLGAAAESARRGLAHNGQKYALLRGQLWDGLHTAIPGITRHTPTDALPNTLSVSLPGVRGADVLTAARRVAASTGSACHAGDERPSAVLTAMGVGRAEAMGTIRLSVGHGTTTHDIADAIADLHQAYLSLV
jgi:cysteine desulfurase